MLRRQSPGLDPDLTLCWVWGVAWPLNQSQDLHLNRTILKGSECLLWDFLLRCDQLFFWISVPIHTRKGYKPKLKGKMSAPFSICSCISVEPGSCGLRGDDLSFWCHHAHLVEDTTPWQLEDVRDFLSSAGHYHTTSSSRCQSSAQLRDCGREWLKSAVQFSLW